jgi:hypothetical protein
MFLTSGSQAFTLTAIKLNRSLSGVEAILLASAPLSQRLRSVNGLVIKSQKNSRLETGQ